MVLRAFAKVIAASRATNTVKDFTDGDFIIVYIRGHERGERRSAAPSVRYSEIASAAKTLQHRKHPFDQPPRCLDEKISIQNHR